ncbi:MAG: hypothetical protein WC130_11120 [Kiritimatiellia bacterium]
MGDILIVGGGLALRDILAFGEYLGEESITKIILYFGAHSEFDINWIAEWAVCISAPGADSLNPAGIFGDLFLFDELPSALFCEFYHCRLLHRSGVVFIADFPGTDGGAPVTQGRRAAIYPAFGLVGITEIIAVNFKSN